MFWHLLSCCGIIRQCFLILKSDWSSEFRYNCSTAATFEFIIKLESNWLFYCSCCCWLFYVVITLLMKWNSAKSIRLLDRLSRTEKPSSSATGWSRWTHRQCHHVGLVSWVYISIKADGQWPNCLQQAHGVGRCRVASEHSEEEPFLFFDISMLECSRPCSKLPHKIQKQILKLLTCVFPSL